jgi:hypothetical protein
MLYPFYTILGIFILLCTITNHFSNPMKSLPIKDSYDESTVGRERSVLPAGLRSAPTKQSEENPKALSAGPLRVEPTIIEPDLVAKGR